MVKTSVKKVKRVEVAAVSNRTPVQVRSLEGIISGLPDRTTAVVTVSRTLIHSKYKKRIIRSAKYHAPIPEGVKAILGSKVRIFASRPRSRTKRWLIRST